MDTHQSRYAVVKKTSIVNALINTLIAVFKVTVGYIGHSSALIADGLHSFSDLITDAMVLLASKAGIQQPDDDHPYGHQRIETIASVIISLLFIGVGASIVIDAILHFLHKTNLQTPSLAVLIVAGASIFANEFLFRYTKKQADRINSPLLMTNAWHNRADVYVSLIVLLSVTLSWLGFTYFDLIGALIIAGMIIKMGGKLVYSSINELLDASVDESTLNNIRQCIENVNGVTSIHQLRTRSHSGTIFADVHIQVSPMISVSEGHYISEQVYASLKKNFKEMADITVHIDPEDDEISQPSLNLPSRDQLLRTIFPKWQTLPGYDDIKRITLHYLDGHILIECQLPLSVTNNINAKELSQTYTNALKPVTYIQRVVILLSDSEDTTA